jgi:hypothetical protein
MSSRLTYLLGGAVCLLTTVSPALALTFPFTENFSTSASNWRDNGSLASTYVATDGVGGGGYISTDFSFEELTAGPALFRAHNAFDSSNDAFVGNWLTAGVGVVRAYVRHNAPEPIDYFVRIATSNNFPGLAIELSQSVPANSEWTLLEFDTSASNPLLSVEGPPSAYASVMGAVGNVQFGVSLPAGLTDDPVAYTFGLDRISIGVPEPTGLLLALGSLIVGLSSRVMRPRNR